MLRISKIDSKKCEIDTTKKSIFCVLDFPIIFCTQTCITKTSKTLKVTAFLYLVMDHIISGSVKENCAAYFESKLRLCGLCVCDAAPILYSK